jgi:phage/plasmid-like protein (TIGR03299 family)
MGIDKDESLFHARLGDVMYGTAAGDYQKDPLGLLKAANLDWEVKKRPLFTSNRDGEDSMELDVVTAKRVPGRYALTRTDNDQIMDIVGPGYKPVQNKDAVDFFSRFIDAGHMQMESIGSLKDGRVIFALAKIGETFNVGRNDPVDGYMLLLSPHLINHSLMGFFTPTRVHCTNQMRFDLGESLSKRRSLGQVASGLANRNQGRFRMPHSIEFDEGTKALAEKALGASKKQMAEFKELTQFLASKRAGEAMVNNYFKQVHNPKLINPANPQAIIEANDNDKDPRVVGMFQEALVNSPGNQLATAKGTWWGALNAVTYVTDHKMGRTPETRLANHWIGETASMKTRALALAIDYAKAA